MSSRQYLQTNDSKQSAAISAQTSLASRLFAPQSQPEPIAEPKLTLEEKLAKIERAGRSGHSLSKMEIVPGDAVSPQPIQMKMAIGAPGDKYEQEAESPAETIRKAVSMQTLSRLHVPEPQPMITGEPVQRVDLPEDNDELRMKIEPRPIQRVDLADENNELMIKSLIQRQLGFGGMVATPDSEQSTLVKWGSSLEGIKSTEGPESAQPDVSQQINLQALYISPKLTVGEPNDKYEQEADRVATQVVKTINSPEASQPAQQEAGGEDLQMKPDRVAVQRSSARPQISDLRMKPLRVWRRPTTGQPNLLLQAHNTLHRQVGVEGGAVSGDIESSIQRARGGGQTLSDNIRQPMEQAFEADFSGVKIHTDSTADSLNRSLNARAFTTGSDLFFKKGAYNPNSQAGQELLAHELTHVVQQGGALKPKPAEQQQDVVQTKDVVHETAADRSIQRNGAEKGQKKSRWQKFKEFLLKPWWKLALEALSHLGKGTALAVKAAGFIVASSGALALTELPALIGSIANFFIGVFKGTRSILMYQGTHKTTKKTTFKALTGLEGTLGLAASLGSLGIGVFTGGMAVVGKALQGAAKGCGALENSIKIYRARYSPPADAPAWYAAFKSGTLKLAEVTVGALGNVFNFIGSILTMDLADFVKAIIQAVSTIQDIFKAGRANDDFEAATNTAKAELAKSDEPDPVSQAGWSNEVAYVSEDDSDLYDIGTEQPYEPNPDETYDDYLESLNI